MKDKDADLVIIGNPGVGLSALVASNVSVSVKNVPLVVPVLDRQDRDTLKGHDSLSMSRSFSVDMELEPSPEFDKFIKILQEEHRKHHEEMVEQFFQQETSRFHSYLNVLPEFNSNHPGCIYSNKPVA